MASRSLKQRPAKPQPKPRIAPAATPVSAPSAVRANLSMLDKEKIAYVEIPQPPIYRVGRYQFHAGTGQGMWRSVDGLPERRGYGVRDLIDAVRDDEAHASDDVARERAQEAAEAGLAGVEAALNDRTPRPPKPPEELPSQWPPPRHGE